MKRERAIDLAEHLLRNLADGQETWPLSLVTAVYVFGSFARGALTPGDLDIDIEKTSDQQWSTHFVRSLSAGRDPFIPLRKALATGRRGYQFAVQYWDMEGRDFEMTLLWKRGDTPRTDANATTASPASAARLRSSPARCGNSIPISAPA